MPRSGTGGSLNSRASAPPESARSRWRTLGLRLLATVGLLVGLTLVVADPRELARQLATVSAWAVAAGVVVTAADRVLMALKWRLLLTARGVPLGAWTAIRAYFATSFAGLFLPVTLGADAIRVIAVRRLGVYDVTASIVVERSLGGVAIALVGLAGCGFLATRFANLELRHATVALLAVAVGLTVAFVLSLRVAAWWSEREHAFARPLAKLAAAYSAYRQHTGILVVFGLLSVVECFLPVLIGIISARGLGLDWPAWVFVSTIPLALTIARLPISLGGFGVQEAAFVYLARLLGYSATDALAVMLVTDGVLVLTLLPAAVDSEMLGLRRAVGDRGAPDLVPTGSSVAPLNAREQK
jgi:uncharacterized membrane protein YbhN (UPF0104 family)